MAKRGQGTRSSKTSGSGDVNNVTKLWSTFSTQMEDKLRDLFESSAAEYQDIYKSWTELSDKMGKQMPGFNLDDKGIFNNLYNSWKEYSEKLNADIIKFPRSDDESHNDLIKFWTDYSDKFSDQLSDFVRDGIKEQYELYELWMDTFAKTADDGSKTGDVPSIINKYWLDMFNRLHDLFTTKPVSPGDNTSHLEHGEQIYKQYEEMHNYWYDTYQKMLDEIMRSPAYGNTLAKAINSSMDSQKMLEKMMTQNLKSLGVPTRNELEEIRSELKNITTQLDELNQTIKNLPSK